VGAIDGRRGEGALDVPVSSGIREEPADHVHGAVVEDAREDLTLPRFGCLGDQRFDRPRGLEKSPVQRGLEDLQVLDQATEALHRIGPVIAQQVFELLRRIAEGDEGSIPGHPEDAVVRARGQQLEAVLVQLEQLQHLLAKYEQRPRADAVLVALEELLGRRHPPWPVGLLDHQDLESVLGEDAGGCQAIVARTDHDRVVVSHTEPPLWHLPSAHAAEV
jgi:hypothetical protein